MENQASSSSSSSSSMKMQFLLLEQVQFMDVNDDSLLQWELVDVIDAEEQQEVVEEEEAEEEFDHDGEIDVFGASDSSPIEGIVHFPPHLVDADLKDHDEDDDGGEDDDDDDDDDDDRYDLDDELVPWNVGNKFVRQRMRKLGKRECSKMHNSKKNPYLFVRPGCVRGKHGLGLKHTY